MSDTTFLASPCCVNSSTVIFIHIFKRIFYINKQKINAFLATLSLTGNKPVKYKYLSTSTCQVSHTECSVQQIYEIVTGITLHKYIIKIY